MPIKEKKELRQPMVVVALFVIIGLYAGWFINLYTTTALGVTAALVALYTLRSSTWLMALLLFMFGVSVTTMWRDAGKGIGSEQRELSIKIIGRNRAYVESFRGSDGEWHDARKLLYYGTDSTLNLVAGDRLITNSRIWEFDGGGYLSLNERNSHFEKSDSRWMERLNDKACDKIERLNLSPEAQSLVKSMLLGRRETMDKELVRSYNRSGAAHMLALSGLHLGIIYLIFTLLLQPLNILPYGHIARQIIVILLLWGYTMVVGMGASVVRAAIMLTTLRSAHLLHRPYNSTSALLMAVMTMTLLNPSALFDIGFWLSLIAVFAIVIWGMPIKNRIRRWVCNRKWSAAMESLVESTVLMLIISTICSIALLPLLSYTFGYISLWGALITPIILSTTYMILISSMLWLLIGFGWLSTLFGSFIEAMSLIQNNIIRTVAESENGIYHFTLERWEMITIYALYLAITLFATRHKPRKS